MSGPSPLSSVRTITPFSKNLKMRITEKNKKICNKFLRCFFATLK